MDILKTAGEIGFFETAANIESFIGSAELESKIGAAMPLPSPGVRERTEKIAEWMLGFNKSKYLFLTPELAVAEALKEKAKKSGSSAPTNEIEIIFAAPCGMDEESKERLRANLPRGLKTEILAEPNFLEGFYPKNAMIAAFGYAAGGRAMVLPDTYRMAEHYSGFRGKKIFVPYTEIEDPLRYDGWVEINAQHFSAEWRSE